MARVGFSRGDFEVFSIPGFSARMQKIYLRITPRLNRLGVELAPELSRRLRVELFPHSAQHRRRTSAPPGETWIAWGPSRAGYKRAAYVALFVSSAGLHARLVVSHDAEGRGAMARALATNSAELEKSFRGAKIQRYEDWDFRKMPPLTSAGRDFFMSLADAIAGKTGAIDVGFGWAVRDALRLDRAELLDAFAELAPLYRALRV
ncbi:MAG TPA: DUF1054 family protein [Candidatus Acidoferrales bacterium]|nr:DUF1054 family protein [Candidatus Acidoferrales bacterium]